MESRHIILIINLAYCVALCAIHIYFRRKGRGDKK